MNFLQNTERKTVLILLAGSAAIAVIIVSVLIMPKGEPLSSEQALQKEVAGIVAKGDARSCDSIQDSIYKTVCINNIALQKAGEKLNIDECQKLDNTLVSIESCVFDITSKKALSEGNPALCSAIANTQSARLCMLQTSTAIAVKKGDPNICKSFGLNQNDANRCYNTVLLTPTVAGGKLSIPIKTIDCSILAGSDFQKDCRLFQNAIVSGIEGSLSTCSKMITEEFKRMCSASVYIGN